eukprot:TRINITY_DN376_c1_g1_i5.p1 TRINITY_DN376_c1_g1~~TRINITY_DN376_c1_g1_i5.p1  ORF type:complete len:1344 (+),score=204.40 TRINITY_DN376_c1_g1_i5:436-4467(+)
MATDDSDVQYDSPDEPALPVCASDGMSAEPEQRCQWVLDGRKGDEDMCRRWSTDETLRDGLAPWYLATEHDTRLRSVVQNMNAAAAIIPGGVSRLSWSAELSSLHLLCVSTGMAQVTTVERPRLETLLPQFVLRAGSFVTNALRSIMAGVLDGSPVHVSASEDLGTDACEWVHPSIPLTLSYVGFAELGGGHSSFLWVSESCTDRVSAFSRALDQQSISPDLMGEAQLAVADVQREYRDIQAKPKEEMVEAVKAFAPAILNAWNLAASWWLLIHLDYGAPQPLSAALGTALTHDQRVALLQLDLATDILGSVSDTLGGRTAAGGRARPVPIGGSGETGVFGTPTSPSLPRQPVSSMTDGDSSLGTPVAHCPTSAANEPFHPASSAGSEPFPRSQSDWPARPTALLEDKVTTAYRELLAPEEAPEWRRSGPEQSVALLNIDNCCWMNSILYPLFLCPDFRSLIMGFRPHKQEWQRLASAAECTVAEDAAVRFVHRLQNLFAFLGPTTEQRYAFSFYVKEAFEDYRRIVGVRRSRRDPGGDWQARDAWTFDKGWLRADDSTKRAVSIRLEDDPDSAGEDGEPTPYTISMIRGSFVTVWKGRLRKISDSARAKMAELSPELREAAQTMKWWVMLRRAGLPETRYLVMWLRLVTGDRIEAVEWPSKRRGIFGGVRFTLCRVGAGGARNTECAFSDAGDFVLELPDLLRCAGQAADAVLGEACAGQSQRMQDGVSRTLFASSREHKLSVTDRFTQGQAVLIGSGSELQGRTAVVESDEGRYYVVSLADGSRYSVPAEQVGVQPECTFPIVLTVPPLQPLRGTLPEGTPCQVWWAGGWNQCEIVATHRGTRGDPQTDSLYVGQWVRLLSPLTVPEAGLELQADSLGCIRYMSVEFDTVDLLMCGWHVSADPVQLEPAQEPDLWYEVRLTSEGFAGTEDADIGMVQDYFVRPRPQPLMGRLISFLETAGHSVRSLHETPRLLIIQLAERNPKSQVDLLDVPETLSLGPLMDANERGTEVRKNMLRADKHRDSVQEWNAGCVPDAALGLSSMPQHLIDALPPETLEGLREAQRLLAEHAASLMDGLDRASRRCNASCEQARQQCIQANAESEDDPRGLYFLHAAVIYDTQHYWVYVRNRAFPGGEFEWLRCNDLPPRGTLRRPQAEPANLSQVLADCTGGNGHAATLLFYMRADAMAEPDDLADGEWIPEHLQRLVEADNQWLEHRVRVAQERRERLQRERDERLEKLSQLQVGAKVRFRCTVRLERRTYRPGDVGTVTAAMGSENVCEGCVEVDDIYDADADAVDVHVVDPWICAVCTFSNEVYERVCEMCATPRGDEDAPVGSGTRITM